MNEWNLMVPETRVANVHFLSLIVWIACLFNRVRNGRSRSSKVADVGTNRKSVCDFLLVINSNFRPILHRFWDTATYWLKIAIIFPIPLLCPRSGWTLVIMCDGQAITINPYLVFSLTIFPYHYSRTTCFNAAWDDSVILPDFQTVFLPKLS